MNRLRLLPVTVALVLSACVSTTIRQQDGSWPPDADFGMVAQNPVAYTGSSVVWGGEIIGVAEVQGKTELIMLQIPLNHLGRLTEARYSTGRFVARCNERLDLNAYTIGRKLVVHGTVTGSETKPLGHRDNYTYPVVDLEEIHVWREDADGVLRHCWQTMGWQGPYLWRCEEEMP